MAVVEAANAVRDTLRTPDGLVPLLRVLLRLCGSSNWPEEFGRNPAAAGWFLQQHPLVFRVYGMPTCASGNGQSLAASSGEHPQFDTRQLQKVLVGLLPS